MSPRSRPARLALAAGLAAALAGCAVMRIDVDVYKGPLANEEDVQMEQFAAMAIGAKPLLIALRDHLQWPGKTNKARECVRGAPWYRAGYFQNPRRIERSSSEMPPSTESASVACKFGKRIPWNEHAGRVNAVLSHYDDKTLPSLEPFIEAGNTAIERYQQAMDVFFNKKASRKAWDKIRNGLVPLGDDQVLRKHFGIGSGATIGKFPQAFETLVLAYENYFGVDLTQQERNRLAKKPIKKDRRADSVHDAYQNFLEEYRKFVGKAESRIPRSKYVQFEKGMIDEADKDQGSNFRFEKLRSPEVLDQHVRVLFVQENSDEAKLFKETVAGLANSFHEARQVLRDLWLNSLEALKFMAGSTNFDNVPGMSARHSYARLIGFLVHPRYLRGALNADKAPEAVRGDLKRLLSEFYRAWDDTPESGTFDFSQAEASVAQAIEAKPLEAANLLARAHDWFILAQENDFPDTSNLKYASRRSYGIVRGPTFEVTELQALLDGWDRVTSAAAVGLDVGRLPEGIETLIDKYLVEAARRSPTGSSDATTGWKEEAKKKKAA